MSQESARNELHDSWAQASVRTLRTAQILYARRPDRPWAAPVGWNRLESWQKGAWCREADALLEEIGVENTDRDPDSALVDSTTRLVEAAARFDPDSYAGKKAQEAVAGFVETVCRPTTVKPGPEPQPEPRHDRLTVTLVGPEIERYRHHDGLVLELDGIETDLLQRPRERLAIVGRNLGHQPSGTMETDGGAKAEGEAEAG